MLVKEIMENIFKRILNFENDVEIYEPRVYKNGKKVCYKIATISNWHYYTDYPEMAKLSKKQHIYDELEADWNIHIPHSPSDVNEIRYIIRLKCRFTKPNQRKK